MCIVQFHIFFTAGIVMTVTVRRRAFCIFGENGNEIQRLRCLQTQWKPASGTIRLIVVLGGVLRNSGSEGPEPRPDRKRLVGGNAGPGTAAAC